MKHSTGSIISLASLLTFIPLAGFAETASEGCGSNGWSSGTYTMQSGDIPRTFRVHVPRGYNKSNPAPLVTIFHGWGGNENEFIGNRKVRAEADKRGYILVAPRGLGSGDLDQSYNSWTFSGSDTGLDGDDVNPGVAGDTEAICDATLEDGTGTTPDYHYPSCAQEGNVIAQNTCSWTQCQQSDVDFVVDLVAKVGENLCVDEDRVFATGGSNGGMFTWELGQNGDSAPLFRAIAPLIGLPHRGYLDPQGKPENGDLPVIVITGTRDTTVPPGAWDDPGFTTTSNGNDGYYYTGATAITEVWAEAHDCDFTIGDKAKPFNVGVRKADCRTYCSSDPGWPRVLDCRARMGHSYGLSWSWKLILSFFDEHSGAGND
jgi:polyhydroxybutyrate depolymerase